MGKEEMLKTGQNLFETLIDVCYFTALEDDMRQIIFAVEKDNEKELNQLKSENEELKKQLDEAIIENGKESGFWGRIASRKTNENKELKNSLKEVLSQLEDRGGFDAIVLGIKQLLTNK